MRYPQPPGDRHGDSRMIGFDGLLMSDDLSMRALAAR